jgi:uncharacterized protein
VLSRAGRALAWAVPLALVAAALPLAALDVPFLSGRVVDQADLLTPEERQRIDEKLRAFEEKSGAQIAVLTIESLEGEPLEDYSLRVAETWKLGREKFDDGALFLVAEQDRKMRIEVGYGLEDTLTDLQAGQILDNGVRPLFREGRFGAGIEGGVDAIIGTLEGRADAIPAAPAGPPSIPIDQAPLPFKALFFGIYFAVIGTFSLLALFSKGPQSGCLYFFLMPFHLFFPMVLHRWAGVAMFVAWLVGFPLFKAWLHKTKAGKSFLERHPGWKTFASGGGGGFGGGGGWSWSSGGGGGGGGGGFSGGGGSFGGGGASSSW